MPFPVLVAVGVAFVAVDVWLGVWLWRNVKVCEAPAGAGDDGCVA